MGDRVEPTEGLLDPETMKEAGDSCLGSELADRGQTAFGQCRRCNIRGELREVSRCQPKAAPLVLAKLRASSFAALRLAPRISTSSAASLVSSQARARSIRERLAIEVTTVVVMPEG